MIVNPIYRDNINTFIVTSFSKVQKLVDFFESRVWKGVRETGKIMKNSMKIVVLKAPEIGLRIHSAIAGIGLLSAISFLLSLKSIPAKIQGLLNNLELRDIEGIILKLTDLLKSPAELLDSVTTFVNSLGALGAIPIITFFAIIALPLGITLLTYSTIKSAYLMIHQIIFITQLPKTEDRLKNFIDNKLKSKEIDIVKARHINTLIRRTDIKIVNIMRNMRKHFEINPNDTRTAKKALKDLKTLTVRKIGVNSVGLAANLAMLVALIVSAALAISPIVLPIISVSKAGVVLGTHAYQTHFFDRGLNLPAFTKNPSLCKS